MGNPYTSVTVSNFNSNPPPDDGSNVPANEVTWAGIKTKIGDPLNTAIAAVNTNALAAFGKVAGGVTAVATTYTVLAGDQGKVVVSSTGDTITTPSASVVGSPFKFSIFNNSAATLTVDGSGSQTIDGAASITLPPKSGAEFDTDGSNWVTHGQPAPLPRGYIAGLQLTNDSDADHDISIAVGECRDSANVKNLILASALVKRIDASWATGTGNGGLASGVTLSNTTWYHLFLVDKTDGTIDAGWDTDLTATNLLSDTGGTRYRRLGSVLTDGSANILGFKQYGDHFIWNVPPETATASDANPAINVSLAVPTGLAILAEVSGWAAALTNGAATHLYNGSVTPGVATSNGPAVVGGTITADSGNPVFAQQAIAPVWVRTNTSSQIKAVSTNAAGTVTVHTLSWIDRRGRDD